MDPEDFIKKELKLKVLIRNLNSNLTYGAIIDLLKKFNYYRGFNKPDNQSDDKNIRSKRTD